MTTVTQLSHLFINLGYSKKFKFHIVLPNNLPPSHEVPFGHTRYKIEAHYNGLSTLDYFNVNQWVGLDKRNDITVSLIIFNNFH